MNRLPITVLACLLPACAHAPQAGRYDRAFVAQAAPAQAYRFTNTVDVGEVSDVPMLEALSRFLELADGGAKQITLRIDSFGGSIYLGARWGRALEDVKKAHSIRVTCIVDGAAYSMAAVILQSPLCDERLATVRSTVLFHNGRSTAKGTAVELQEAGGHLEALNTAMALTVSTRLGISLADYRGRIAHGDWIMAVLEALAANVVDGLVSPMDIAPPGLPVVGVQQ